jgi:hypothetical protein
VGQLKICDQGVRDAFAEAEDRGITPGALISELSRSHLGSVEACFGE